MGAKISVDSATMMNKGLEFIEAMHLFSVRPEDIEILIHPESVVHSAVELIDGTVIAQLGVPDMALPIQYALTWPERRESASERLDLTALSGLHFMKPDLKNCPASRWPWTAPSAAARLRRCSPRPTRRRWRCFWAAGWGIMRYMTVLPRLSAA